MAGWRGLRFGDWDSGLAALVIEFLNKGGKLLKIKNIILKYEKLQIVDLSLVKVFISSHSSLYQTL